MSNCNSPAFIVIDGLKFRVRHYNPIRKTVIIRHPWTLKDDEWHVSEVDRILDKDGEVIEEGELW